MEGNMRNPFKAIVAALVATLSLFCFAGCGSSGSGSSSGSGQSSPSSKVWTVNDLVGTKWKLKGDVVEFTKTKMNVLPVDYNTVPEAAFEDGAGVRTNLLTVTEDGKDINDVNPNGYQMAYELSSYCPAGASGPDKMHLVFNMAKCPANTFFLAASNTGPGNSMFILKIAADGKSCDIALDQSDIGAVGLTTDDPESEWVFGDQSWKQASLNNNTATFTKVG
jgi:hypothetical protein